MSGMWTICEVVLRGAWRPGLAGLGTRSERRWWLRDSLSEAADVDLLAVEPKEGAEIGVTEAKRVGGNGVKHRLHIRLRLTDYPQDFASRGLLFERFLGRVEQAHVSDGDRRLRGKGLDEGNLVGREQSGFAAPQEERAVGASFVNKRNGKDGPESCPSRVCPRTREFTVDERNDVGMMDGCAVERGATADGGPVQRDRMHGERWYAFGRILGQRAHDVALGKQDARVGRVAQARSQTRDRV